MSLIHQKNIVTFFFSFCKIPLQTHIGIKYIIIITNNAIYKTADIQAQFKRAHLMLFCTVQYLLSGDPLFLLYHLINSIIDPVKMSLCSGTAFRIAVWLFQHTQLFFCSNSYRTEIQVFSFSEQSKCLLSHTSGNGLGSQIE